MSPSLLIKDEICPHSGILQLISQLALYLGSDKRRNDTRYTGITDTLRLASITASILDG